MAKLGVVQWRLDKPEKRSLIIGVEAFMNPDGVRYVSSAFCFGNSGKFIEFDYLTSHQTKEFAGMRTEPNVKRIGNTKIASKATKATITTSLKNICW